MCWDAGVQLCPGRRPGQAVHVSVSSLSPDRHTLSGVALCILAAFIVLEGHDPYVSLALLAAAMGALHCVFGRDPEELREALLPSAQDVHQRERHLAPAGANANWVCSAGMDCFGPPSSLEGQAAQSHGLPAVFRPSCPPGRCIACADANRPHLVTFRHDLQNPGHGFVPELGLGCWCGIDSNELYMC